MLIHMTNGICNSCTVIKPAYIKRNTSHGLVAVYLNEMIKTNHM